MSRNRSIEAAHEVHLKNGMMLTLRPAVESDAEQMIQYLNQVGGESDNLLFGADEFHMTVEQEKAFITQASDDPQTLMLLGLIGDQIVSISHIGGTRRKRIAHNSDLSVSVKKSHWGLGIGRAVMEALIAFAHENPVIQIISLGVKKDNAKAKVLYESLGFEAIGIHKNFFNINGVYDDEILMDLHLE